MAACRVSVWQRQVQGEAAVLHMRADGMAVTDMSSAPPRLHASIRPGAVRFEITQNAFYAR